MKRILKTSALALLVVLGSSLLNKTSAQYYDNYNKRQQDVTYQTFYDDLSPYGQWIDYPNYGYVWVPDAGPDFRPYSSNGHWVWTDDYEWMWVSDYDWGWAPFHYGRWEEDNDYGWFWVPGYEWSPAWVAWRDGGDYYGWAPLRPGINISINFNIGGYSPPYDYWSFAPRRYITSPRIFDYCVDRRQNVMIINHTTIIVNNSGYSNNYGFRSGPSRYEAERYCGRINPVRFRDSYTPGRTQFRNNEVSFYRPNVRRDNERSISPRQFERYDRNNDNRTTRNDNNRNDHVNNQGQFRRDNNDFRQPRNNNDNNGQNNRSNDNRVFRPTERVDRNANPGNDNNNNRRFDRTNDNNGNRNTPIRQQDVRSNDQQQQQPRQFERRQQDVRINDQQQQQPRQFERRQQDVRINDQPQQQPRQFERRQQDVRSIDQPQQQQPVQQMERRQEPQTRQSDRRDDGNRQQNTGDRNNENGNSRKRF
ncbi:MAG TPA: DUF6600 domain-containing protein [Chitinophagaceae bacterium]